MGERQQAGRVARRDPGGDAGQEEVGRPGWERSGRRRASSGGGVLEIVRVAEPAPVHGRRHRFEVGLPRRRRIEALQLPSGVQEQRQRSAGTLADEREVRAHPRDMGALEVVEMPGARQLEERPGGVRGAGTELLLGGGERASDTVAAGMSQLGRALEERGRRRRPAAPARSVGGTFELVRDGVVELVRGLRQMPRAAVRVRVRLGRRAQRLMGRAAVRGARGAVDGGAHERMTEADARADLDEACSLGGRCRVEADPELVGRSTEHRRVADGLGRREGQELPGRGGHRPDDPEESALQLSREGAGVRPFEASRELCRGQDAGQLQEGERVAARLRDDPVAYVGVEPTGEGRVEQRPGVVRRQPFDRELREAAHLVREVRLADREDHGDGIGTEASCDERERLQGDLVEPLCVVDHAHQR
nr:hypothetical protein GCM10025730_00700 [Promicromonospora thailandica]